MRKFPTQEQIDTAVLWLGINEGDGRERESCEAVALWLAEEIRDRYIRSAARSAGLPMAKVRARLKGQL